MVVYAEAPSLINAGDRASSCSWGRLCRTYKCLAVYLTFSSTPSSPIPPAQSTFLALAYLLTRHGAGVIEDILGVLLQRPPRHLKEAEGRLWLNQKAQLILAGLLAL